MSAKLPSIKTLPEAKEELARVADSISRLQEFVVHFSGVMDQLNEMRGVAAAPTQLEMGKIAEPKFERVANLPFTDRVLLILKDAGKPMFQKSIVAEYTRRAWPLPGNVPLAKAINGAISYLSKRKQIIVRTDDGYVFASANQSAA